MDASLRVKLDPRLREARGKARVQVFVEVANAEAARWLKRQRGVTKLVNVVDGYYTAAVESGEVAKIAAGEGIIEVERVRYLRPSLIHSLDSIRGREPVRRGGAVPDGRGVVIGFVDYGLDYRLADFRNGRKTRIAYLWDHELRAKGRERSPHKYGYGVEYTSEDFDRKRRIRHSPVLEDRVSGHGTHVAGIAAGNGRTFDDQFAEGKFVGVAPAATIVFVNLKRSHVLEQVGAESGTIANSVELAHGIAYCFEKADALGMPCVVNLSVGFNGGGHDGNMAVEWIIDGLLRKPGRAVVIAAGNEDEPEFSVHARGNARVGGNPLVLDWEIGMADPQNPRDDPTTNELEVWYSRGSALTVSLEDVEGNESPRVSGGRRRRWRSPGGEDVIIDSDPSTPWAGSARIHISIHQGRRESGIRSGRWRVKLQATKAVQGRLVRVDAWIERDTVPAERAHERSRFARKHYQARTAITLTTPSTARRAITVACYANDAAAEPVSFFSGRGPTRDGRAKPDLAAPGHPILSSNALAGTPDEEGRIRPARASRGGTSMSAPHVAGVVARILGRNAFLTTAEIQDLLIKSASRARWHPKWGHGRVDAAKALQLLEELHGAGRKAR